MHNLPEKLDLAVLNVHSPNLPRYLILETQKYPQTRGVVLKSYNNFQKKNDHFIINTKAIAYWAIHSRAQRLLEGQ